jgi:ankyrin repeat protein
MGGNAALRLLSVLALADGARVGLHKAAEAGDLAPLKVAIEGYRDPYEDEWKTPDLNAKNKKGHVALHLAVCNKKLDIESVRLLLDKGADANVKDGADETALQVVARMCDHAGDYYSHQVEDGRQSTKLARLLLKHGADPNLASMATQRTPLHTAAARGHHNLVQLLLSWGAQPNVRDASGSTPLHLASSAIKPRIVLALLRAGADPSLLNHDSRSAADEVAAGRDSAASTIRKYLSNAASLHAEAVEEKEREKAAKAAAKEAAGKKEL